MGAELSAMEENQTLTNNKLGTKIGVGSYGTVFITNKKHATKVIKFEDNIASVFMECGILSSFKHTNIIHARSIVWDGKENQVYVVQDLALYGQERYSFLQNLNNDFELIRDLSLQLVEAVKCLHSLGFLHRDIHINNVLFFKNKHGHVVAKLNDFGLSTKMITTNKKLPLSVYAYTLSVRPPEILECQIKQEEYCMYNQAADIWALGLTLMHFITGRYPFEVETEGDTKNEEKKNIKSKEENDDVVDEKNTLALIRKWYKKQTSYELKLKNLTRFTTRNNNMLRKNIEFYNNITNLLSQMLQYNDTSRSNIDSVSKHVFFESLTKKESMMKCQVVPVIRASILNVITSSKNRRNILELLKSTVRHWLHRIRIDKENELPIVVRAYEYYCTAKSSKSFSTVARKLGSMELIYACGILACFNIYADYGPDEADLHKIQKLHPGIYPNGFQQYKESMMAILYLNKFKVFRESVWKDIQDKHEPIEFLISMKKDVLTVNK